MLIITQDKKGLVILENVLNIEIHKEGRLRFVLYAGMKAPDDNYRELGCFKNEKRAKEVIQEIAIRYDCSMMKIGKSYLSKTKYDFVFEIPER